MVPVVLYKLNEREAIKMDPNSTKQPMAQRTTLAFIKKKRTDEENLLEMTAATNSNVESSMVSAASNVQSRTNVESLVDRKCLAKVHEMAYLSLYIFKISWGACPQTPLGARAFGTRFAGRLILALSRLL